LQKKLKVPFKEVAIVEPSEKHWYQPLWTLIGAGEFKKEDSMRDESPLIPKGTTWVKDGVHQYKPKENYVITKSGKKITYDYLIVASGVGIWWYFGVLYFVI
jgi:NADH dehydrogenase FAD-containing subunit